MRLPAILSRWSALLTPPVIPSLWRKLRACQEKRAASKQIAPHNKLHLGCGNHLLPGWANIDLLDSPGVIRWDLTRRLPVRDNSVDFIFNEHFIEHVEQGQARKLLRECFRVLRPGGVLRLSTPDLDVLVAAYREGRLVDWEDVQWTPASACQMMNEGMRAWGHQFVYNRQELAAILAECHLDSVSHVAWRQSEHSELAGLECRPFHDEIIVECRKAGQ